VHGYHLADTTQLGGGDGVLYRFKNGKDTISVVVAPYGADIPQSPNSATAVVEGEVAPVRDAFDQAAQRGDLLAYHKFGERADAIHVGSSAITYYWYFAAVQRRGEQGKYIYYAAYAPALGTVRVRAEFPWAGFVTAPPRVGALAPPGTGRGSPGGTTDSPLSPGGQPILDEGTQQSNRPIGVASSPTQGLGAGPYRDQLLAFGNDLITAMVNHPTPVPVATAIDAPGPQRHLTASPPLCNAVAAATDTIIYRIYGTLEAPSRSDPLPSGYVELVLDALRHSFIVPNPLSPQVYAPMVAAGNEVMVPAVYGEVGFTLDDQGKLSDLALTQSSLSSAMDRSLYDAPRRADSLQAFPGQVGVDHPGPIRFFFALSSYQPKGGRSMAFFDVRMPAWRPGSRPAVDLDVQPTLASGAAQPAAGDTVVIQLVIDEHGAPVNGTMRLLGATHIEYAKAIVDAAMHSQYTPAMAAGCPVKGLLERSWRMAATGAH
jgi:hypothetical protein